MADVHQESVKLNRAQLREQVHLKVQLGVMNDMIAFVMANDDKKLFWGRKGDTFVSDLCYIFMYKMIEGIGSDKLEDSIQLDAGSHITHTTVGHNMDELRPILVKWARSKIVTGSKGDWDKAAEGEVFPEPFSGVNLWMDSSDFPIQATRENDGWTSHKLGGAGIRVQFITDAHLRILYCVGPLHPKQYDGDFLDLYHTDIAEKFREGTIIADNHYLNGEKHFPEGPTFMVHHRESPTDKKVGDEENIPIHCPNRKRKATIDISNLSEEERAKSISMLTKNNNLSHIRGRIESVFGNMKRKFPILSERHVDKRLRLYQYILIASAIHNMIVEKNLAIALFIDENSN